MCFKINHLFKLTIITKNFLKGQSIGLNNYPTYKFTVLYCNLNLINFVSIVKTKVI